MKCENIYKRRDGLREGRYNSGYNESGKEKYRSVYGKTYGEVKEKLAVMKSAPETHKASGRLTVKELFEEWLSAVKIRDKASTFANYRMKADKHILPQFGGIRYENLTAAINQDKIDEAYNNALSDFMNSDGIPELITVSGEMSSGASSIAEVYSISEDNLIRLCRANEKIWYTLCENNIGNTA